MTTPYPERSKEQVGYRLRTLREVLKLKAKDMAAEVNVEANTWSQWENGKRMADLSAMTRVWDRFGADLNYIFLGRTDTLPFDLAMKVREKFATAPAESHGDDMTSTAQAVADSPGSAKRRKTAA